MGVPSQMARGTIEIVQDVKVVEGGNRVGTSEATLLNLLNISPFTYGMTVVQIFDKGQVFSSSVLDVTDDELVGRVAAAIKQVAGISLAVNYPTIASIMHSFVNSYKKVLFTSIATDYEYDGAA